MNFQTKKKPVIVLLSIVFMALYLGVSLAQIKHRADQFYSEFEEKAKADIRTQYFFTKEALETGKMELLEDQLNTAFKNGYISFYQIRYGTEILKSKARPEDKQVAEYDYPETKAPVILPNYYLATVAKGKLKATLGKNYDRSNFIKVWFEEEKGPIAIDFAFVATILVLIASYFLRDILSVLKIFGHTKKVPQRDYSKIQAKSKEADLFIRGLTSYENLVGDLTSQNTKLKNQVLPALQSEISSGKKPPYEFNCTLVRTDINNFSHIFSTHAVEPFMQSINRFFESATEIISRYNGLVHEFVGDEIIYYFKDEHTENSALAAISAVRDINKAAEAISAQTKKDFGYPFTVKSSVAYGRLRFGLQVRNYSLAGSVLIETVRILSHVSEKEENTCYYDETVELKVNSLIVSQMEQKVQLKGIPEPRQLYSYRQHRPLIHVLKNLETEQTYRQLPYYRSDNEIAATLAFLCENHENLEQQTFLQALGSFRTMTALKTLPQVKENYFHLLSQLLEARQKLSRPREAYFLSSAIKIGVNLISTDSFDQIYTRILQECLQVQDRRVVANAVDVLCALTPEASDSVIRELIKHPDNRVRANALVFEGIRELQKRDLRLLRSMLDSKNDSYQASALYALGEIAFHYKNSDAVFYNTESNLQKLVGRIGEFFTSENEMVRRQAYFAARKVKDTKLDAKIHHLFRKTKSEQVKSDIATYYREGRQAS